MVHSYPGPGDTVHVLEIHKVTFKKCLLLTKELNSQRELLRQGGEEPVSGAWLCRDSASWDQMQCGRVVGLSLRWKIASLSGLGFHDHKAERAECLTRNWIRAICGWKCSLLSCTSFRNRPILFTVALRHIVLGFLNLQYN